MSIVRVVWHDAFADTNSWIDPEGIDDEPCVTESVGFLLADAKKGHIAIAQSKNSEESVDSVLFIPVEMVRSILLVS